MVVKKVIMIVAGLVLAGGIVIGARYLISVKEYQKAVKEISIKNVDLLKVADGSYIGSYDVNFVAAKVKVDVENHKIIDIDLLEHKTERGKKAEVIPKKVVQAQSLKVDTISGATNSSKVILKSIENALEKGEK